jgi:hypothetical protein
MRGGVGVLCNDKRRVELTDAEQRLAKFIALKRFERNRHDGTIDRKIGPQSNEFTDLVGIGAEIAFCKIFNVYPDMQIEKRNSCDAIICGGVSVDVKTTKYKNGKLLVALWKKERNPPDMYALMVGEMPRFVFVGFIKNNDLFVDNRIIDLGYGPTYFCEQSDLFFL